MGGIKRPGEGGQERRSGIIGREGGRRQAWERMREMEREEKEGTRRFKREKEMTHFLYCEKCVRLAHTSTPTNRHPRRNLR